MRRKPWPIIFLSLFFLCTPIFNILGAAIRYHNDASFIQLLKILFLDPSNRMSLFNMFIPSLLASFAVYKVKKWSFPIVFLCISWLAYTSYIDFNKSSGYWSLAIGIILPTLINLVLSSYILLPNIYKYYQNNMLRWWERDTRYIYPTKIEIIIDNIPHNFNLENISRGGCLISNVADFDINAPITIIMTILNHPLELKASVGHKRLTSNSWVYGLQFIDINSENKVRLKKIATEFKKKNVPHANPLPYWKDDLLDWFRSLTTK
jgi:hypothetical protein